MKNIFSKATFIIIFLFFSVNLFAQSKAVFVSGTEGYKSFRIPAIIKAPNGNLLAFCEGRVNGSGDFGNIKIVLKRSSDNGKTWSALQIVASNDSLQSDCGCSSAKNCWLIGQPCFHSSLRKELFGSNEK